MSEARTPDAVLTLQTGDVRTRYEIFHSSQFAGKASRSEFYHAEQPSLLLTPADMEATQYVRVRVNDRGFCRRHPRGYRCIGCFYF